jgi:hypothetical protein
MNQMYCAILGFIVRMRNRRILSLREKMLECDELAHQLMMRNAKTAVKWKIAEGNLIAARNLNKAISQNKRKQPKPRTCAVRIMN